MVVPECGEIPCANSKDGTMHKKTDYLATMETQLKKWDADMDELVAAGARANDNARNDYQDGLKGLRAKRDSAHNTLQEMRLATQEAGEKMQAKMSAAWETMQKSLEKVSADLTK
jgi:hypothetical protein